MLNCPLRLEKQLMEIQKDLQKLLLLEDLLLLMHLQSQKILQISNRKILLPYRDTHTIEP